MTAEELITEAFQEIGVIQPGETLQTADATFGLSKLSRLIDLWNADREAIYADQFLTFTLTPSLQPHTIGPTGATWTTDQRPVSIEGASLVVGTINYPIRLRLAAWWQNQWNPTLTSNIPTDLYYDATWPNGTLYFWPVPTAGYSVQLLMRGILNTYLLSTTFDLPPGYREALTLTLAEQLAAPYGTQAQPSTVMAARHARAQIQDNNTPTPPLRTKDAGLPGTRQSWFDWRSGLVR